MSGIDEVIIRLRGACKERPDSRIAADVGALLADHARLRAEADALRVDSQRLNWLESQVKEYGDGHYSRLEASLIFFWQQTKPDEVYPGFRESIDAAMGADA